MQAIFVILYCINNIIRLYRFKNNIYKYCTKWFNKTKNRLLKNKFNIIDSPSLNSDWYYVY